MAQKKRMSFGERVKAGLVKKIYGSKVCPKCGQLGYGDVRQKLGGDSKKVRVLFQHVYVDVDGKKKQTFCYLGLEGEKTVIKGHRRVEHWTCQCGYETDAKSHLIYHVIEKHGFKRGFKEYENIRKWIMENCKKKVEWIPKNQP